MTKQTQFPAPRRFDHGRAALTTTLRPGYLAQMAICHRERVNWLRPAGLIIVLAAASTVCLFFYSSTLEDAYITFRYAVHLAEGHGLGAWNVGEPPVEGYTTFLWMLLLALGKVLGLSPLTLAKLLGWLAFLGLLALVYRADHFLRSLAPEWDWSAGGVLAAVWLAGYLPLGWYAVSGMESLLYILLLVTTLLLAVKNAEGGWSDVIAAGLLLLTRPEGILPAMVILLGVALHRWRHGIPAGRALRKPIIVAGVQLALIAFRLAYYGHVFPNAYYAKVAGGGWDHVGLGLSYLYDALKGWRYWLPLLPWIAAVIIALRRRSNHWPLLACLILVPLVFLFVARTGGDNPSAFPYVRHLLHALPLMLLPGLAALAGRGPSWRRGAIILTVAGLLVMNLAVLHKIGPLNREYLAWREGERPSGMWLAHEPPSELTDWIRRTFPARTRMAVALGGELPFFTDFPAIDMLGLSNEYIAHHGRFQGDVVDSKTDMAYVISLKPDLIESTLDVRAILEGRPHPRNRPWRGLMEDALLDNRIFHDEYLFIRNAPYDSWPRALFVRRDYWQSLPNRADVEAVAVTETSLVQPILAR